MGAMSEELQATEEVIEAEPVRPLPVRSENRAIEIWGREVGPLAVAAAYLLSPSNRGRRRRA